MPFGTLLHDFTLVHSPFLSSIPFNILLIISCVMFVFATTDMARPLLFFFSLPRGFFYTLTHYNLCNKRRSSTNIAHFHYPIFYTLFQPEILLSLRVVLETSL